MEQQSPVVVLTIFIQRKVILSIAKLFRTTGNKHIVITKEIMETGYLWREQRHWIYMYNLVTINLISFWWGGVEEKLHIWAIILSPRDLHFSNYQAHGLHYNPQ